VDPELCGARRESRWIKVLGCSRPVRVSLKGKVAERSVLAAERNFLERTIELRDSGAGA
jgi:hypothetical protein